MSSKRSPPSAKRPRAQIIAPPHARHRIPVALQHLPLHALPLHWRAALSPPPPPPPPAPPRIPAPHPPPKPAPTPNHNTRTPDTIQDPAVYDPRAYNPNAPLLTPVPSPLLFSPGPAPTHHAPTDLIFSYSVTPTNVWQSQTLIPTQPHDSQLRAIPPSARAASQGPTLNFSHFAPQMPPRNQTPTASFPLSTPLSTSGPISIQNHDHPTNPSDFPGQSTPQTHILSPKLTLTDIPHSATLHPVFSPNFPPSVMSDPHSSSVFQSFVAPPSPPQPHTPARASPPKPQLQRNSFCRKPKRRKSSNPKTINTRKPVDRPLPDSKALDLLFSPLMHQGGLPLITPQPESPPHPKTSSATQILSLTPQLQSQKHSSPLSHPPTQSHTLVPQRVSQQPPCQENMDDDVPLVRPGSSQRPLSVPPTARVKMSVKKGPAKKAHVARQRKGTTLPAEGKKAAKKSSTSVPLVTSGNPSAVANDQTTTPAKKILMKKTIAKKVRGKGQRKEKTSNAEKKKGNKPPLDCLVGMNQKLSPVVENQAKAPTKKISPKKSPAKKTLAKKAQVKGRRKDCSLGPKKKIVKTSVLDLALTKSKTPSSASERKPKKATKKSLSKKARAAADRKDATLNADKKVAKKTVAPMSPGARPKPLSDTPEQTLKLVPTSPSQNAKFTSHRTCGPLSTTKEGAGSSESPMSVGVKGRKLSSVSNEKKKFGALSPHKRPQEQDIVDRTGIYDVSCNLSAMDKKSASLERPTNIDCVNDAPIEELQISKAPRAPTPTCLRPSSRSQKDIDWSMTPAPTNAGWPKLSLPSPAVPQKTFSSSNSRPSAQRKLDSGIQLPYCLDNARPTLRSTLLTTDNDMLTRGMKKARASAACNTRAGAVDSKRLPSDEKIPSGDKIESGSKCTPPEEGKDKAFSSSETLPSLRSKDSEADMTQADTAQSPVSISEEQDDELEANAPAAKLGCESTVVQRRKPKASEPLCVSTAEDAQETTDILKCIFVKLPLRDPARAARRLSRTAKKDMLEKDGTKAGPKKRPRLRSQPAKKAAKAPPPKGSSISKGKGSHPLVPKKGKASSKGNAATKVLKPTIAKSVPPRVSRGKPVLRLKLRDRSKKVSMLEDVHTDDPPSSSHGPGIKSSQPKQTLIPAGNTTAGDAPCREPALEVEKEVRRSARVTRDAPTLEQILGSGNTRAPIMPPEDLLSKMRKLKCSLCLSSIEIGDQKKHPFFQIRSLHLCETCQDHISTSSHAFAAISSGALSGEHCGPWKQSSALAFVTEGLVRNLRPSERRKAELTAAHDRIVLQSKESVGKRVEALSVPLEMIAIIQLLLLEIGVAFKAGGMVWPEGTISLPENDDTRSMISNVLPLSLDDIRSGRSAGERAWESVFGENERCASLTSCAIFGKVLDLVGVATEHVGGCGGNTSDGSGKCCVRVDQTSVKAVSSWASKSSTAAQRIFKERPDDVTEEHLGHHEICCVCILPLVPATFPFRYSKCGGCRKTFCSVCLSNVLGSSEYVRALCEDSYSCVGCRWKQKQSFLAKGQWGLKSISSTKKTTTVTEDRRSTLPLLLLSSPIRKKLHQVRNHKKLQFEIRFAQLCDSLNYQGCTSHVRDKGCSPKPICFQCCSLDSDDTGTESTESGISRAPFVTCSGKKCSTVMHRHCVEGYKPSKTRGRSGMVCKQHKCSVCAGRDEARLVRCRTCPVTYCRDHAPPAPDIHIYSDKFIACPTCKPYLHFPRMSTQRPPPLPKRISHANNIAISFALDQRQRQAVADRAVSKLYDGEDKMSATSIERGYVFDLHRTCFRKV